MAVFVDVSAAGAVSLGVAAVGVIGFVLAFADADPGYFDPRPAARRAGTAVHQVAVHAGHDFNRAIASSQRLARHTASDAALTVAALLALLLPASGGTR